MKLVRDKTPGAHAVRVPCCAEDHYTTSPARGPLFGGHTRMFTMAEGVIDQDGPAFKAYYCPACAAKLIEGGAVVRGEYFSEYGQTIFRPTKGG